jgi:ribonuclease HI
MPTAPAPATRGPAAGAWFRRTTNNRMEILAAVRGLEAVAPDVPATVVSDSRYVVDMLNGGHVERWRRGGWMRDRRHAALNPDLWEQLLKACAGRAVRFEWVRGHNGHPENERADVLAAEARAAEGLPADKAYEEPPLFAGDSLFG